MTGIDLKVKRIERRIAAADLAERMRVVPSRISQIEALAVVTPATTKRYLRALATFPVVENVR